MHARSETLAGAEAKAAAGTRHLDAREAQETYKTYEPDEHEASSGGFVGPVRMLLNEARGLLAIANRVGRKLLRGGLREQLLTELPHRIQLLDEAQRAWDRQRSRTTPAALHGAEERARQLRTDMLAAGRYVLRQDPEAQRELDRIADPNGAPDLAADLRTLATFFSPRPEALRSADLAADTPARARELAAQLTLAHADDGHARDPETQRNHAMALVLEAVREIRAAGQFVFRSLPARIEIFRCELAHVREADRTEGRDRHAVN